MRDGLDMAPVHVPHQELRDVLVRRITPRNLAGLWRYLRLRLRFRRLRVGLFYLDRGADFTVGPSANVRFGRRVRFMRDATAKLYGTVTIGDDVFFNRGCHVVVHSRLTVGAHCLFGELVSIHDEAHIPGADDRPLASRGLVARPITLGDNVWVGAKTTILSGVHIGDNVVIGANSVVTRDIPSNTVAVGAPAQALRRL